jgi:hypothetical protein
MQLQMQLKGFIKGNFEFRSTWNGTRVVTKDMVNFSVKKFYFDAHKLSYFTF